MTVLRFDPFRDLDRLTEQMLGVPAGSARAPRFMPMDLYRSGDHYVVHADLPGIDPGSVDVSVDSGTLTIRAERKTPEGRRHLFNNRAFGKVQRTITLPDDVDGEGVVAAFNQGVLTISLPKRAESKPRKINLKGN